MSTEIIGLSQREQKIIANTVLYNQEEFASFEEIKDVYKRQTQHSLEVIW